MSTTTRRAHRPLAAFARTGIAAALPGLLAPLAAGAGEITRQVWRDLGGIGVPALTSSDRFPTGPDLEDTLASFEAPASWADSYGTRIAGYIIAPATGPYTFWIASDDAGELWLSSGDSPADVELIASVPGYTDPRQWNRYSEQRSGSKYLQAGRAYYVEALQKEGYGADHVAVAWEGPGFTQRVIDGAYLAPLTGAERYPPRALIDMATTTVDSAVVVDVIGNDIDYNGAGTLRVLAVDQASFEGGLVVDMGDGSAMYVPPSGYSGLDFFAYAIVDDSGMLGGGEVIVAVNQPADPDAARSQLLSGVSELAGMTENGRVAVFGPDSFGVIRDDGGNTMLGAASVGAGRVVAFGDGRHADFSAFGDQLDNGALYTNALAWASRVGGTGVRVVTNVSGTRSWLAARGYGDVGYSTEWDRSLSGADVLVLDPESELTEDQIERLARFVANGGGLVAGEHGPDLAWWLGSLAKAPANRAMRLAGLGWASGEQGQQGATRLSGVYANAMGALSLVGGGGGPSDRAEAASAISAALDVLPATDLDRTVIENTLWGHVAGLIPTPSHPVSDVLDQSILRWESGIVASTPVADLTAHRTAEPVFGVIPPGAPRVTKTLTLEQDAPLGTYGQDWISWISTGLYAPPGETVTVTAPPSLVNSGVRVRVSGEWDSVSHRDTYQRMPYGISRAFSIASTTTDVGNAYGGLIYFDVPSNVAPGVFATTISDAIEAPTFVPGRDTNADWIGRIRDLPGPWAEFITDTQIVTVRADEIRDEVHAEELAQLLHDVVWVQDDLAGVVGRRTRPERFYNEIQNAAGAAYASYPCMAWNWAGQADWDNMSTNGSWGMFHEMGHLHQSGYWTFDGTGEVTVNIFSMASFDLAVGHPDPGGWGAQWDPVYRVSAYRQARAAGGFDNVDLGQKLAMFSQMKAAFGWDPFRAFFREYLDATSGLPRNDLEKRDQWMTRFSRIVGYDMSPFFVGWGLGVSQSAIDSLSDLPRWNMIETAPDGASTPSGRSVVIDDMLDNDFSFDGVLTLAGAGGGSHGQVGVIGDAIVYTPDPDFSGPDWIWYEVVNGFGNSFTETIGITVTDGYGLVHRWPLDEAVGTIAADSAGGLDGTYVGGPTLGEDGATAALGSSVHFSGSGQYVRVPAMNLYTNGATFTAWIRRDGDQDAFAGLIFSRSGSTTAGLNLRYSNELGYHWNDAPDTYNFGSGLTVPDGEWTFGALVVEPSRATIYMSDGQVLRRAVNNVSHGIEEFDGYTLIARDQSGREFRGWIDDVRVYGRALSEDEVRDVFLGVDGCRADFNGDGLVNSQDFIAYLNTFVAGVPAADFNRDGVIDSQDFIAFLNAFVAGC